MRRFVILTLVILLAITAIVLMRIREGVETNPIAEKSSSVEIQFQIGNEGSENVSTPIQLRSGEERRSISNVDQLAKKQSAASDDWESESIGESISRQLKKFQAVLESDSWSAESLQELTAGDLECTPLCPRTLDLSFQTERMKVRRLSRESGVAAEKIPFDLACKELFTWFGVGPNRHVKFKLTRIQVHPTSIDTEIRVEASTRQANSGRQFVAQWNCEWRRTTRSDSNDSAASRNQLEFSPPLKSISLQQYEETEIAIHAGRLFSDATKSVLGANTCYAQQHTVGINRWLSQIPREFLGQLGHHGMAIGDVNGDDLDDIYVCDAGGLPNRLYVQQLDGTAIDVSQKAGVDFLENSRGALIVDLDNDGDQDLVVGLDGMIVVAANQGEGRFEIIQRLEINVDTFSISAADYDLDGRLDLFICGYDVRRRNPTDNGLPFPLPYHDANNGGRNLLLNNEGELRFVDVTSTVGLDDNTRFSMAAGWEDVDDDGDLDLYVANDFGRNSLYLNDGGRFRNIAEHANVEDHASGMSVSWGDFNRDGRPDLYVGNMFSAAGNRVTFQERFSDGIAQETVGHLRRMARGNSLFANACEPGLQRFRDVTMDQAVEMGRWSWASKFVDFNNDGWQDLVVANGYITGDDEDDL